MDFRETRTHPATCHCQASCAFISPNQGCHTQASMCEQPPLEVSKESVQCLRSRPSSIASANLGNTSGMPTDTHQQWKDRSLVHACKIPLLSPLPAPPPRLPPTLHPGQNLTQSVLSWNQDVKLGCPLWSVHQAGWGWSVLTTAGPWASLGQKRRPSCRKTQSWGTEKIIGTKAQSSRWVELLPPPRECLPHTSACPPPHPL